jgi:hypothetical protein
MYTSLVVFGRAARMAARTLLLGSVPLNTEAVRHERDISNAVR